MQNQTLVFNGKEKFNIKDFPTQIDDIYEDKADYEARIVENAEAIDTLQNLMYAHNRYGIVMIFQAMDAAGKDGTIQHVLKGVNPFGVKVYNFKRPSETEIDHDFLWRANACLPERGTISVFNRSYYEEVLVVKVHQNILTDIQKIPEELIQKPEKVWKERYADIVNFEQYLHNNGFLVVKFFLHVSKKEQAERLIERIEDPTKNWKFEEADVAERNLWDKYQAAYQDAINATATEIAPWHVIPADDKKNMRLLVGEAIISQMKNLEMSFPKPDTARQATLKKLIDVIKQQNER